MCKSDKIFVAFKQYMMVIFMNSILSGKAIMCAKIPICIIKKYRVYLKGLICIF